MNEGSLAGSATPYRRAPDGLMSIMNDLAAPVINPCRNCYHIKHDTHPSMVRDGDGPLSSDDFCF